MVLYALKQSNTWNDAALHMVRKLLIFRDFVQSRQCMRCSKPVKDKDFIPLEVGGTYDLCSYRAALSEISVPVDFSFEAARNEKRS